MNIVIDEFNDNTGFVTYGTATILDENELREYIAGPTNTKSTQFEFNTNGDIVEKTGLNIDVTDYDYAICHFHSNYNKYSEGQYTITFNDTNFFEIKLFKELTEVYFQLDEISLITKIAIEYKGDGQDYLISSHCLAVQDELPIDIFKSAQDELTRQLEDSIGNGFILGTVDTQAGDDRIALNQIAYSNLEYIDRYSQILIEDGTNEEKHVLADNDENYFTFEKIEDGDQIINNFTGANVYLNIPVRYGVNQTEYTTPGIYITGYNPEETLRSGKIEQVFSTFEDGTSYTRNSDAIQTHYIQVACITRTETDIMSFMSQLVRNFIAREILWINGNKFDIIFEGRPEFIQWEDSENPISGLIYTFKLEIKEEIWKNLKLPKLLQTNLEVTIRQN